MAPISATPSPWAHSAAMDTQGWGSGLGRRRWPASGTDEDQRVTPGGRPAGDQRAVGQLGHGRLPEHPVGTVELGRLGAQATGSEPGAGIGAT